MKIPLKCANCPNKRDNCKCPVAEKEQPMVEEDFIVTASCAAQTATASNENYIQRYITNPVFIESITIPRNWNITSGTINTYNYGEIDDGTRHR